MSLYTLLFSFSFSLITNFKSRKWHKIGKFWFARRFDNKSKLIGILVSKFVIKCNTQTNVSQFIWRPHFADKMIELESKWQRNSGSLFFRQILLLFKFILLFSFSYSTHHLILLCPINTSTWMCFVSLLHQFETFETFSRAKTKQNQLNGIPYSIDI